MQLNFQIDHIDALIEMMLLVMFRIVEVLQYHQNN